MILKAFFNTLNGLFVALPSKKLITNFVPVLLFKRAITFHRSSKFEVFLWDKSFYGKCNGVQNCILSHEEQDAGL